MKTKLIRVLLACLVICSMYTPLFAMDYTVLISKLNSIKADVEDMKNEYENILIQYSDVIDSLSSGNKANAVDLADNVLAEGIKEKVDAIKLELQGSSAPGSAEVLTAINNLENNAKDLIQENNDAFGELKSGCENMTAEEVKQVVEKVKEISKSLGYTKDTTAVYTTLIGILDDARSMGNETNNKIKDILSSNVDTFKEVMTIDVLKQTLNDVKSKDKEAFVNTLNNALKGASNEATVRASLNEVKTELKALKNKLLEADELDEEILLALDSAQRTTITNKIKDIESDYVNFIKLVLNSYVNDYLDAVIEIACDEDVDEVVEYVNELLDYINDHSGTIENFKNKSVLDAIKELNLTGDLKNIANKSTILMALVFNSAESYGPDYLYNSFKNEISSVIEHLADGVVDYIDNIDTSLKKEIANEIKGNTAQAAQSSIKVINAKRFETIENIQKLKIRIDTEIIAKRPEFAEKQSLVNKAANYTYNMYRNNILDTIEKIMALEGEKVGKTYEFNSVRLFILADNFVSKNVVADGLGIPDKYASIISYSNILNNKIKTGSTMTITLSDTVSEDYTYAVLGDVYADGKINSQDYVAIRNYIMEVDNLGEINKIAADTYRNGTINSQDYVKIKNYIMNNESIKL